MEPHFKGLPIELMYGIIAIIGGIARYLNSYVNGAPFKVGIFLASMVISGFSGYMFAYLAIALNIPFPMIFMMAGVGGFFGDQTMKLLLEYVQKQIK